MPEEETVEIEFQGNKPEVFMMTIEGAHVEFIAHPGVNKIDRRIFEEIKNSPLVKIHKRKKSDKEVD